MCDAGLNRLQLHWHALPSAIRVQFSDVALRGVSSWLQASVRIRIDRHQRHLRCTERVVRRVQDRLCVRMVWQRGGVLHRCLSRRQKRPRVLQLVLRCVRLQRGGTVRWPRRVQVRSWLRE
jgi:hypothetical protein